MASAASAPSNVLCITHLANCPNPNQPTIFSDEPNLSTEAIIQYLHKNRTCVVVKLTRRSEFPNNPVDSIASPGLGVTEIARTVCELLEWKRPNGGLKNHECRQLLERLAAEGVLTPPELRRSRNRNRTCPTTLPTSASNSPRRECFGWLG